MALTKRILLVVPQRKEREDLAKHLDRAGYLLIQVEDGALAINKAIVDPPDMVITQAAMPMVDGFKLCQLLRTNPVTRHIPFIFITDKETNPKKLGQFIRPDDDFILKPFKVEELLGRVHNLFYRMDKVQEVSQEADRSVAGTLTEIALVDLLQIFKMNRKNGVLTLKADGVTGQIMIRDGVLINARLGKVMRREGHLPAHLLAPRDVRVQAGPDRLRGAHPPAGREPDHGGPAPARRAEPDTVEADPPQGIGAAAQDLGRQR